MFAKTDSNLHLLLLLYYMSHDLQNPSDVHMVDIILLQLFVKCLGNQSCLQCIEYVNLFSNWTFFN